MSFFNGILYLFIFLYFLVAFILEPPKLECIIKKVYYKKSVLKKSVAYKLTKQTLLGVKLTFLAFLLFFKAYIYIFLLFKEIIKWSFSAWVLSRAITTHSVCYALLNETPEGGWFFFTYMPNFLKFCRFSLYYLRATFFCSFFSTGF